MKFEELKKAYMEYVKKVLSSNNLELDYSMLFIEEFEEDELGGKAIANTLVNKLANWWDRYGYPSFKEYYEEYCIENGEYDSIEEY